MALNLPTIILDDFFKRAYTSTIFYCVKGINQNEAAAFSAYRHLLFSAGCSTESPPAEGEKENNYRIIISC